MIHKASVFHITKTLNLPLSLHSMEAEFFDHSVMSALTIPLKLTPEILNDREMGIHRRTILGVGSPDNHAYP